MQNRLIEIAKELAALYMDRAAQKNMLATFENHQAARELQLLPVGGWAGKNPEERTAAKQTALMNDEQWTMSQDGLLDTRQNLNDIEGCMNGLQAEKAAIEWTIRDTANTLLGAPSVFDALADGIKDTVQEMITDTESAGVTTEDM